MFTDGMTTCICGSQAALKNGIMQRHTAPCGAICHFGCYVGDAETTEKIKAGKIFVHRRALNDECSERSECPNGCFLDRSATSGAESGLDRRGHE